MIKNGRFELWHDGRMSNVKNNVVLQYITEGAPELLREGKIYFGSLPAGRAITWDDMRGVLSKVLLYAVLRKKLRGIKKEGKLLQ